MMDRTSPGCKCPACFTTENSRSVLGLPFRQSAGTGHTLFHLAMHASLPVIGAVLIGPSWWAMAPLCGFLAAYLANSFILCPTCAYHHAGVRSCGCYPKSIFPYRRYLGERWDGRTNFIGRSTVILLTVGPTIAVLLAQGNSMGAAIMFVLPAVVVFLTSTLSCPNCRQQDVCFLGRLTTASIRRMNL
ncbi:MAG: hypothetical protein ACYC7L_07285 [Nitrospirota bacterium]